MDLDRTRKFVKIDKDLGYYFRYYKLGYIVRDYLEPDTRPSTV